MKIGVVSVGNGVDVVDVWHLSGTGNLLFVDMCRWDSIAFIFRSRKHFTAFSVSGLDDLVFIKFDCLELSPLYVSLCFFRVLR